MREKERAEQREREHKQEREKQERDRIERERLEQKQRAEQAVHKHFEESLRLAHAKVSHVHVDKASHVEHASLVRMLVEYVMQNGVTLKCHHGRWRVGHVAQQIDIDNFTSCDFLFIYSIIIPRNTVDTSNIMHDFARSPLPLLHSLLTLVGSPLSKIGCTFQQS